jgi:phage tail-like protein
VDLARDYRLGRLRLRRAYPTSGGWISSILDSRVHDTTWHKMEFEADLPPGCAVRVQTATSNVRDDLATAPAWTPEGTEDDVPTAVDPGAPDLLIQSPPGRFFRVRISLTSNGRGTPSLRALRILFPRNSYLDSLPRIYRTAAGESRFLEQYLALCEHAFTRLEDRYEEFSRWLDPEAAPPGMLVWLAGLLDLAFDKDWPLARRRALLLRINELYRIKGTPRGISEYIRAYTGLESQVQEEFLRRPRQPAFLGRRGFVLGTTSLLNSASPDHGADEALIRAFAHRFTVLVYLGQHDCSERALSVVERIVAANKPAHTAHKVVPVYPGMSLGVGSRVGIDMVLGGRSVPQAAIGACDDEADGASTLGQGMVLGDLNPAFPRPRGRRL